MTRWKKIVPAVAVAVALITGTALAAENFNTGETTHSQAATEAAVSGGAVASGPAAGGDAPQGTPPSGQKPDGTPPAGGRTDRVAREAHQEGHRADSQVPVCPVTTRSSPLPVTRLYRTQPFPLPARMKMPSMFREEQRQI